MFVLVANLRLEIQDIVRPPVLIVEQELRRALQPDDAYNPGPIRQLDIAQAMQLVVDGLEPIERRAVRPGTRAPHPHLERHLVVAQLVIRRGAAVGSDDDYLVRGVRELSPENRLAENPQPLLLQVAGNALYPHPTSPPQRLLDLAGDVLLD